jgi:hypothetical protein
MTKIELALILRIIDCHTKTYASNYYNGSDTKRIDNVNALKEDITRHYEQIMKEEN